MNPWTVHDELHQMKLQLSQQGLSMLHQQDKMARLEIELSKLRKKNKTRKTENRLIFERTLEPPLISE